MTDTHEDARTTAPTDTQTRYHYTECGLDNVYIMDMPPREDDKGNAVAEILSIGYLHGILAMDLSVRDGGWSGKELRFIRTEMNMTQAKLADLVRKDRQTVIRWEGGSHDIDPNAEVIIRMKMIEFLFEQDFFKTLRGANGGR